MARKAPKNRMAMGPMLDMPMQDKHEKMVSEMHGALHTLSDKIRQPYPSSGDKLLPSELRPSESDDSKRARKHIENLHAAMKGCKD